MILQHYPELLDYVNAKLHPHATADFPDVKDALYVAGVRDRAKKFVAGAS